MEFREVWSGCSRSLSRNQGHVRRIGFYAAVFIGCVLFCLPGFAQSNLGEIIGSVTDQTGGAIVGATVTVTNVNTGISRTLTTNAAGQYAAPSINPGTYTVRAVAKGFQAIQQQNVTVGVGATARINLKLQPGAQTQTVTVTEAVPIVNTTNATLGGALTTQNLGQLPINGRSYVKMMDLVPGSVTRSGNDFEFNGAPNNAQLYIFDGLPEQNVAHTGPIAGGTSGFTEATILPMDAIEQMQVQTNPSAEYGGEIGGVVQVGIKSGTNAIHGTAFAMGRDSALEARTRFLAADQPKNQDLFEQFGATVGGPIVKDKLFYFLAYEGQRYRIGVPAIFKKPAALPAAGSPDPTHNIPDAIAGLLAANITPSALSLNLAGCPSTAPYTPCTGGIFGNPTDSAVVPGSVPLPGGSDNGIVKIDYHPNDKNSINGEFYRGDGTSQQESSPTTTAEPYWLTQRLVHSTLGRAVWVATPNSNWVNEMRFGYTRQWKTNTPAECSGVTGPDYASLYNFIIVPVAAPYCGFPQTFINGFTGIGTHESSGGPALIGLTPIGGTDTVSYIHGSHSIKFGFSVIDTITNGDSKLNYIHGRLDFGKGIDAFSGATPLEDFMAGQVSKSQVLVGTVPPLINSSYWRYAVFAQDDWHAARNLTVNLGLRWDIMPAPGFDNNQAGSFLPSQGMVQLGKQIKSLYPTDYKDFGPRLGLAWDVSGNGTTVVRAGGSIMYEWLPINPFLSAGQAAAVNLVPTGYTLYAADGSVLPSPGNLDTANLVGRGNALVNWTPGQQVFLTSGANFACGDGLGTVDPTAPISSSNPANPSPCDIQVPDPNMKPGYMGTWTVGVEHAFTNNVSLKVAYVGTRGLRLAINRDVNQPAPGTTNTKSLLNEQLRRPYLSQYPYLGSIISYTNGGSSFYNALQVNLNLRNTHGITALVNYTYSHTLTNIANDYGSYVMNSNNLQLDYGPAAWDYHNALNFSIAYDIPGIKTKGQLLEGWQISSVVSVLSADPWTVADTSNDYSGTGQGLDRWTLLGDPKNIVSVAGPSHVPCFGIPGSAFADSGACTVVQTGSSSPTEFMPAACVTAAANEAVNSSVGTTGLDSLGSEGCYYENGTALVPPAQGTYGTMPPFAFRNGTPYREWDLALSKSFKVTERLSALFRASIYNLPNNTIYDSVQDLGNNDPSAPSIFGSANALNNAGDPVLGSGGPRQINLELHLTF